MPSKCKRCLALGHKEKECHNKPRPGYKPKKPTDALCAYCGMPGHADVAGICPYRVEFEPETVKPCRWCNSLDHTSSRCLQRPRKKGVRCPICLQRGHGVAECNKAGSVKRWPAKLLSKSGMPNPKWVERRTMKMRPKAVYQKHIERRKEKRVKLRRQLADGGKSSGKQAGERKAEAGVKQKKDSKQKSGTGLKQKQKQNSKPKSGAGVPQKQPSKQKSTAKRSLA